jgi:hypothetical protein
MKIKHCTLTIIVLLNKSVEVVEGAERRGRLAIAVANLSQSIDFSERVRSFLVSHRGG